MSIQFQAHRGVSTEYPENTLAAFRAAAQQGYPIIELDPEVTLDKQVVVLHDSTINRTGRQADGSKIPAQISIRDITLAEARTYDFGLWKGEQFRGEPLPLLADVLAFAAEAGMLVKIDNKFFAFSEENQQALFAVLHNSPARLALTCSDPGKIAGLADAFPDAEIHYDGIVSEENLRMLRQTLGDRPLVVWLPIDAPRTAWVKKLGRPFADEALSALVHQYARLGVWILAEEEELRIARDVLHADLIETTGSLKP